MYRAMLRLFPFEFRADFGPDMERTFADERADLSHARSLVVSYRFWLRTIADLVRNAHREHLELLLRDGRVGARALLRDRMFSSVALGTLALGMGGATLVVSIAAGLMTGLIPYKRPESIAILRPTLSDWRLFELLQSDYGPLQGLAAYNERAANLGDPIRPERILVGRVTAGFLPLVEVRVALGRAFSNSDFQEEQPNVVLLTNDLWRRRFGGSEQVVGTRLILDDRVYTVIGVLAAGFRAPGDLAPARAMTVHTGAEVLVPLKGNPQARDPLATDRMWRGVIVLARLRPSFTLDHARSHLRVLTGRLPAGPSRPPVYSFLPLLDYVAGELPGQLSVLAAAVLLLLIVSCANVAHLVLARGVSRGQEMATRSALGAPRAHLVRCTLSESLLLSIGGGVVGVGFASAGGAVLLRIANPVLSRLDQVHIDWRVLGFAVALSLAVGVVVGIIPGLQVARIDPLPALKGQPRSSGRVGHSWWRSTLVVTQIATSVVLLIGAGLLAKDFLRLTRVDLGFKPDGVLVGEVSLSRLKYANPERSDAFFRQLLDRAAELPGIRAAAMTNAAPGGPSAAMANVRVRKSLSFGESDESPDQVERIEVIAGNYFATMGIPIKAGRALDARDTRSSQPVINVNETFSRKHWATVAGSIDREILWGPVTYRVVGVVGDVRDLAGPRTETPRIYLPYEQFSGWSPQMTLLLRGTFDRTLVQPLTRIVRDLNPGQPIYDVRPLSEVVQGVLARRAIILLMISVFGLATLLVAGVGVYGAMSCAVAERVREIAIRLALGGRVGIVVLTVAKRGALLVLFGLALGLPAAFWLTSLLRGQLIGVTHADPGTYVLVSVGVLVLGLVGCVIPVAIAVDEDLFARLRND